MEDSACEERSIDESIPRGLNNFLEIHQECFWSRTSLNVSERFKKKVENLDSIKRKRNEVHRSYLSDVCIPLWRSCFAEAHEQEVALVTETEEKRRRQELQDLHQAFWGEYSSLRTEHSNDCLRAEDRDFPCLFYHSLWLPKFQASTPIAPLGRTLKFGETINEHQLAEYMERYYSGAKGVYRVPPVMFHDDKETISSTGKTKKGKHKHKSPSSEASKSKAKGSPGSQSGQTEGQGQTSTNESGVQKNKGSKDSKSSDRPSAIRDCTGKVNKTSCDSNSGAGGSRIHMNKEREERMTKDKSSSKQSDEREVVKVEGTKPGAESGGKGRKETFVDKINLIKDCDVQECVKLDKLGEDKKTEILRKRKASRAVDEVARRIFEYGMEQSLNLFILTEFEYQSYLQNVKMERDQFITNIKGDHDIIVIWREVGIVFVQVKSNLPNQNPGTIAKDLQKALEQLLSDKFTFWQSNRDLEFIRHLPIYCYIAEPFLTEECLSTMNICPAHKALVLSESAIQSSGSFKLWIEKRITISSGDVFGSDNYHVSVSRYVGQWSRRELPNPIKTTGHQIDRLYLTTEQAKLLKTKAKYQIIAGNYGTGKTLLLTQLAQDILEANPEANIHCISCSDLSKEGLCNPNSPFQAASQMNNLLSKTKPKDAIVNSIVFGRAFKMANPDDPVPPFIFVTGCVFFNTLKKICELDSSKREQHFLLDEVPFVLFEDDREPHLTEFLQQLSETSFVWISIASHTYKVDVGECENPVSVIRRCIPPQFDLGYLKYAMRVSKKLFEMVEEIENYTQDGHHKYSEFGHVIDGPYPRLYTLAKCECETADDQKSTPALPCKCSEERLTDVLAKILIFVGNNYKSDIVIFIEHGVEGAFYKRICQIVHAALSKRGTRSNWLLAFKADVGTGDVSPGATEDPTNVITVADARTFRGCEKRIVIVVDPFRMLQWFRTEGHVGVPTMVLTRCLAQYVHVSWPMDESIVMCYRVLDEYRILIEKIKDLGKVWQAKMREFERQARRELTQVPAAQMTTLVDKLIKKKLILAC